jgi:hypothetical protein
LGCKTLILAFKAADDASNDLGSRLHENRDDGHEAVEDSGSSSGKPEPFNLFAGLNPEPLAPPSGKEIAPSLPPEKAQISEPAAISDENPPSIRTWIYVTMVIVALILGLIIGLQAAK